jgi:hypothetical protein
MLNQTWRMGVGQEATLSMSNSPWWTRVKQQRLRGGSGNKQTSQKKWTSTEQRSKEAQRLRAGVGQQANLSKWGKWWIPVLISWNRGQHSKLNCPTLLGEELTKQSCSWRTMKTTTALTILHTDSCHLPIATNPVDRRSQIPLTSQLPGETLSELLLVCQYQD